MVKYGLVETNDLDGSNLCDIPSGPVVTGVRHFDYADRRIGLRCALVS